MADTPPNPFGDPDATDPTADCPTEPPAESDPELTYDLEPENPS